MDWHGERAWQDMMEEAKRFHERSTIENTIEVKTFTKLRNEGIKRQIETSSKFLWNKISQTSGKRSKKSFVVPILKNNVAGWDPTKYRPTSLTSCACKTMEGMVNRRLREKLEADGRFSFHSTLFAQGMTPVPILPTWAACYKKGTTRASMLTWSRQSL